MMNIHTFMLIISRLNLILEHSVHDFVKLVLVGDPLQLPSVVKGTGGNVRIEEWDVGNIDAESLAEYTSRDTEILVQKYGTTKLFDAQEFIEFSRHAAHVVVLDQNKRAEADPEFTALLQKLRLGIDVAETVELINSQAIITDGTEWLSIPDLVVLTTTKALCEVYNQIAYDYNENQPAVFHSKQRGKLRKTSRGELDIFNPMVVKLKVGLRVMCLVNDNRLGCVNGDIGQVTSIIRGEPLSDDKIEQFRKRGISEHIIDGMITKAEEGARSAVVDFGGREIAISMKEELHYAHKHWGFDKRKRGDKGKLDNKVTGVYYQIALKQATSVTIHKAQGQTLDYMLLDLGNGAFCEGQTYVALSRLRGISGLFLRRPISPDDILFDEAAAAYIRMFSNPDLTEESGTQQSGEEDFGLDTDHGSTDLPESQHL
jgi:ATP-dependent exoDNAse (exonuclease V) alpha subunit